MRKNNGVFLEMSVLKQVSNRTMKLYLGQHLRNIFFYNVNGIKMFYFGLSSK